MPEYFSAEKNLIENLRDETKKKKKKGRNFTSLFRCVDFHLDYGVRVMFWGTISTQLGEKSESMVLIKIYEQTRDYRLDPAWSKPLAGGIHDNYTKGGENEDECRPRACRFAF